MPFDFKESEDFAWPYVSQPQAEFQLPVEENQERREWAQGETFRFGAGQPGALAPGRFPSGTTAAGWQDAAPAPVGLRAGGSGIAPGPSGGAPASMSQARPDPGLLSGGTSRAPAQRQAPSRPGPGTAPVQPGAVPEISWSSLATSSVGPGPRQAASEPSESHPLASAGLGPGPGRPEGWTTLSPASGTPPASIGVFLIGQPSGGDPASSAHPTSPAAMKGPAPRSSGLSSAPWAAAEETLSQRLAAPAESGGGVGASSVVLARQPDGMGGFAAIQDYAELCRPTVAPWDRPPPPPTIGPVEPSDPTPPGPPSRPRPTTPGGFLRRQPEPPGLPGGDGDLPTPGDPGDGDRYAHPCGLSYTLEHQAFRLDILAPGAMRGPANGDVRTFMWSMLDPIPLTAVAQDLHVLYLKCPCPGDGTQAETPVCMQALIDYQWGVEGRGFFVPFDRGRASLMADKQAVLFEPALPQDFEGTVVRKIRVVASHSERDAAKQPAHAPIEAAVTFRFTRISEPLPPLSVETPIECIGMKYIMGTSDTPGMWLPDPHTYPNEVLVRMPETQMRVSMTIEISGSVWKGPPRSKAGSCTPIPTWERGTPLEGLEPRRVGDLTSLRRATPEEYIVLSAEDVGSDLDLLQLKCERGGRCTRDKTLDPPLTFRDSLVYWWELEHVPDDDWRSRRVGPAEPRSVGGGGTPGPSRSLGWPRPEELQSTGSFPFGATPVSSPSFGSIIWKTPKTPGYVAIRLFVGNRFRLLSADPAYVEQQPVADQFVDPPYQLLYEQVVHVRHEENTGGAMAIAWVGQNLAPKPEPSIQPPFQENPGGQTMRGDVEAYYNINRGALDPTADLYWWWDPGSEGQAAGWTIREGDPGDAGRITARTHPWSLAIEGLAESHNPRGPNDLGFENWQAVFDYADDIEYRSIFILLATVRFRRGRVVGLDVDDTGRDSSTHPIIYANPGWTPMRWPAGFKKVVGAAKTLTQCGHLFACHRRKRGVQYQPGILKTRRYQNVVDDDRLFGPALVQVGEFGQSSLRLAFEGAVRLGDVGNCVSQIVANRSAPWVPLVIRLDVGEERSIQQITPGRHFPNWRFYSYDEGRFVPAGEAVPSATDTFNPAATFMQFGDKPRGEDNGI